MMDLPEGDCFWSVSVRFLDTPSGWCSLNSDLCCFVAPLALALAFYLDALVRALGVPIPAKALPPLPQVACPAEHLVGFPGGAPCSLRALS